MKILLIDDDRECLEVLAIALRAAGYECTVETNPLLALELYIKEKYDVVITDIRIPQLSGIDLMKKIKEYDKHAIVLLITAYANQDILPDEEYGKVAGYFRKPINFRKFFKELKAIGQRLENEKRERLAREILRKCKRIDPQWLSRLPVPIYNFVSPIIPESIPWPVIEKQYLTMLDEKGDAIYMLVNQLMDAWECENGNIEFMFSDFNLEYLIEDTIKTKVLPFDGKADYHYDPGCTSWCNSDPRRINQILVNLANAMRYTEFGLSGIRASVVRTQEDAVLLKIVIEDRGPALQAEKREAMFRFPQAAEDECAFNLPLVYALVDRMGGSVTVDSANGKGNTITLLLPVRTVRFYTECRQEQNPILYEKE